MSGIKYPEPIQKRLDDVHSRRAALMESEGWPAPDYESGLQLMFILMGGWPAWRKLNPGHAQSPSPQLNAGEGSAKDVSDIDVGDIKDAIESAAGFYGLSIAEEDCKRRRPTHDFKAGAEWMNAYLSPAANQPTASPAPGEIPADVMEDVVKTGQDKAMKFARVEATRTANEGASYYAGYYDASITMYHRNQQEIADLQARHERAEKNIAALTDQLLKKQTALEQIIHESQVLKTNPNCLSILKIAEEAAK